uniref:Uncharacterized protein n=1 Tax=Onchocerca volvulus TaxID=6282 RepID=A0A8R1TM60_ONCVO
MSSSIIVSIQPPKARVQLCVKELENAYSTWLTYIQNITGTKKGEDEEKTYEQVTGGEHGLFQIMYEGKEALITITRYKNDSEQKLEQLIKRKSKEQERLTTSSNPTVILPQLSLPTFNGDSRQWRQFWSSLNAAVRS